VNAFGVAKVSRVRSIRFEHASRDVILKRRKTPGGHKKRTELPGRTQLILGFTYASYAEGEANKGSYAESIDSIVRF